MIWFIWFRSYPLLFIFLFLKLIFVSGCSNFPQKTYVENPKSLRKQVELVCLNTDASHFRVENLRVRLKKLDDGELELKHYNSLLPDGYYFCTRQKRNSFILD